MLKHRTQTRPGGVSEESLKRRPNMDEHMETPITTRAKTRERFISRDISKGNSKLAAGDTIYRTIKLMQLFEWQNFFKFRLQVTASVVLWSEFLATDPEARVRFPALPEKK
jgi:hypothetical protein